MHSTSLIDSTTLIDTASHERICSRKQCEVLSDSDAERGGHMARQQATVRVRWGCESWESGNLFESRAVGNPRKVSIIDSVEGLDIVIH
jgi:hypothetical protein